MLNNQACHSISIKASRGRPRRDENFSALVGFIAREIYLRSEKSCSELEIEFDMGEREKMPNGTWRRRGFKGREWRRYKQGRSGMVPKRLVNIVRTSLSKGWLRKQWAQLFSPQPIDGIFEFLPSYDYDFCGAAHGGVLYSWHETEVACFKAWHDFVSELTAAKNQDDPHIDHAWLKTFWRNHTEPDVNWDDVLSAADEREIGRATNDFWVDKKLIRRQVKWSANKLYFAAYGDSLQLEDDRREVAQVALLGILKISAEAFTHDALFTADFFDPKSGVNLDRLLRWLAKGKVSTEASVH